MLLEAHSCYTCLYIADIQRGFVEYSGLGLYNHEELYNAKHNAIQGIQYQVVP